MKNLVAQGRPEIGGGESGAIDDKYHVYDITYKSKQYFI